MLPGQQDRIEFIYSTVGVWRADLRILVIITYYKVIKKPQNLESHPIKLYHNPPYMIIGS